MTAIVIPAIFNPRRMPWRLARRRDGMRPWPEPLHAAALDSALDGRQRLSVRDADERTPLDRLRPDADADVGAAIRSGGEIDGIPEAPARPAHAIAEQHT